ncbi:hypothetical protein, partial [Escherichia coli]|uniref:hypothetical protein n=1 Tax=Escherichia coli TaxID=562 RepID=UPI002FBD5F86
MSGKPAARQGDMTQYGGSIVQGSAGVRIGAPTGVEIGRSVVVGKSVVPPVDVGGGRMNKKK